MPNLLDIIRRVRNASGEPRIDRAGGFFPKSKAMGKRVEFVTIPPAIVGKNCSNCSFANHAMHPVFCENPEVRQPVNDRNSCKLWSNPETLKHWE